MDPPLLDRFRDSIHSFDPFESPPLLLLSLYFFGGSIFYPNAHPQRLSFWSDRH